MTWNCFFDFWRFPRIYDDLHNLITKLFLFMCWKILWSQHKRTGKNRGKTKNQQTMPYQVIAHLCIEIIDRSQWNEAVLGDFFKFHVLFGLFTISYLICSNFQILKIKIGNNIFFFYFQGTGPQSLHHIRFQITNPKWTFCIYFNWQSLKWRPRISRWPFKR